MAVQTMRDFDAMSRAAAATITQRSLLIAEAARDPRLLGDPELSLMVTEKIEAAAQVMAAVTPRIMLPALHATRWVEDQTALMARSMTAFGMPGPLAGLWSQSWRMMEGVGLINAAFGAAMIGTMAELGSVALAPVHRAATANARRLSRK